MTEVFDSILNGGSCMIEIELAFKLALVGFGYRLISDILHIFCGRKGGALSD